MLAQFRDPLGDCGGDTNFCFCRGASVSLILGEPDRAWADLRKSIRKFSLARHKCVAGGCNLFEVEDECVLEEPSIAKLPATRNG